MNMTIDYRIPLWAIIGTFLTFGVPIIWTLISMFFAQKNTKTQIAEIKVDMLNQEKTISSIKKDIEDKLDRHKTQNDSKLANINDIMVEVRTMTKLLIEDKIKK